MGKTHGADEHAGQMVDLFAFACAQVEAWIQVDAEPECHHHAQGSGDYCIPTTVTRITANRQRL